MNAIGAAALARARSGACVLPVWWTEPSGTCACPKGAGCSSPGKHPLTPHGLDDASNDPAIVEGWWRKWSRANLGERTDRRPRIDIDLVDVAEQLADDVAFWAQTELVRTPRGGLHIVLETPAPVPSRVLWLADGRRLGELKGARAYVLVPPSIIAERVYEAVSVVGACPLAVPDPIGWLRDLLPPFGLALAEGPSAPKAYQGLAGVIHEGEGRHNALVSYAGRVWVQGMDAETLADLLRVVNERQCQPPLPDAELRDIVEHFVARRTRRGGARSSHIVSGTGPPTIVVNGRHLHEVAADAWSALLAANDPPRFFAHGNAIAEVLNDSLGSPRIVHLSFAGLRGRLDRCAKWVKATDRGELPVPPPKEVVEDLVALEKPLPIIKGVVGTPIVTRDGILASEPGYQAETGLYYLPSGEPVRRVPERPDETDLMLAKRLIGLEFLGDFPFVDEASRAHAMAVPLTVLAREVIDGPTPLFAFDAPAAGTGKGLLARLLVRVATGFEPSIMTDTRDDEELRKRITSVLCAGPAAVIVDNVKRKLDSGALAAVLTTTSWCDRLLGQTQILEVPNRAVWLVTGNNLQMSEELTRRTVWVRQDARCDRPWDREHFRHPDLPGWVARHQHELVWAFLVLIQNWVAKGMCDWSGKPFGSFESWSRVVGGILEAANTPGFLANRAELYRRLDRETEEWRAFLGAWWDLHANQGVKSADVLPLALEQVPSLFERTKETDRALKTALGKALSERRDRRFGDLFLRHAGEDGHAKGALWRLEKAADADVPADVGDSTSAEVPQESGACSDSNAEDAELAEVASGPLRGTARPSGGKGGEATGNSLPHLPQVPHPDSKTASWAAEDVRKMPSPMAELPRCRQCRRPMNVVRVSDLCGRCQA